MNTTVCFRSCRNDGSCCVTTLRLLPKNLAGRICCTSKPEKTSCVSCASKNRNKRSSFPPRLMTNRHERTRQTSKYSHISRLFPTRLARRKGMISGCGWWHMDWVEMTGTLSFSACYSGCLRSLFCLSGGLLSHCLSFWRMPCFPSPLSFTISVPRTIQDSDQVSTLNTVVYQCRTSEQWNTKKHKSLYLTGLAFPPPPNYIISVQQ